MTDPLTLLLALTVGTLATARAVRLITSDAYPPVATLRERWTVWQANRDLDLEAPDGEARGIAHGWGPLLTCPFCFAPYAAAANLAWALTAGLEWTGDWSWSTAWWVVNTWAAVAYVAAMVVVRDEPPAED
ncbi:hypothetical protein Pam4_09 [Pseudanabaena phage Pam4]|nr:hypothetical protein Pam4_09 [Pseudanabaena phage Pam4]